MYQQKVKEKEEKIADLTNKVQAQEARINQLREQAESQPTHSLDEAVTILGRPLSLRLCLYRQLYLTNYDKESSAFERRVGRR